MTDFRFEWQDTQAGDRVHAAEELARANKPSALATLFAAVENDSLTHAIVRHVTADTEKLDPNFRLTPERVQALSDQYGIPMEHMRDVGGALSDTHADRIAQSIRSELDNRQLLAHAGWGGAAASMLVGVLDPATLAATFTPGGVAAWMTRGGALKGAIKGGLVAGMSNAAIEASLAASQHTRDPEEVVQAGLMGLSLGAPLGAAGAMFARSARDAFTATVLRRRAGGELTAAGEKTARIAEVPYHAEPETLRTPEVPNAEPNAPVAAAPVAAADDARIPVAPTAEPAPAALTPEAAHAVPDPVPAAPEPAAVGPVAEPANAAGHEAPSGTAGAPRFAAGDAVEWHGKNGPETGTILEVLPNGHYAVEDASGKVRAFRPEKLDEAGGSDAFLGGSIGSGQAGHIEEGETRFLYAKIGKWRIPLRFDAFAHFAKTDNKAMQFVASRLLDDPVGKKGIVANRVSAAEYSEMEFKRYESQVHHGLETAWAKHVEENKLGLFDRQKAEIPFFEDVSAIVRGDLDAAQRTPHAVAAANEIKSVNKIILERMKRAGIEGAEDVAGNEHYIMRKFNHDRIALLMADPEASPKVRQLISEAIRKVRPEVEVEKADAIAKHYISRVRDIAVDKKNLGFATDQGKARIAELLRAHDTLDEQEVESIIEWMYGQSAKQSDSGNAPRLKKRTFLDENHALEWTDEQGHQHRIAISDLFVNDARTLMRIYTKQTSGLIGLAEAGGIRSRADYEKLRNAAKEEGQAKGVAPEKLSRQLEDLDRVVRYISGAPMYDGLGATTERGIRILKNFNFMKYMAQGGFAQLVEAGQVLGLKTTMALRTGVPEFDATIRRAAKGEMDGQLRRDLIAMGVVAQETRTRRPIASESVMGGLDGHLTRLDNAAAKGAWYVSKYSGMAPLTDFQRGKIVDLYAQRLLNIATGAEKLDDRLLKRLATNGLEGDDLEVMLAKMKEHVVLDENNKLVSIDYDSWEKNSRRTFDDFRLALFREGHRSIQEISIGAAPLWMHHSLARILFQFRSFVMNAWTKQTLYGANHIDLQTFAQWSFSTLFGGLSYTAQTMLNYAHNRDLDSRLTTGRIASAAVQRAGFSSLVPAAVDSTWGFLTGSPVFAHGRTTGLGGNAFNLTSSNPTGNTLGQIANTLSGAVQSVTTSDHVWTKRDALNALGLLPNYFGIKTLVNDFAQDFPAKNYLRAGQH